MDGLCVGLYVGVCDGLYVYEGLCVGPCVALCSHGRLTSQLQATGNLKLSMCSPSTCVYTSSDTYLYFCTHDDTYSVLK